LFILPSPLLRINPEKPGKQKTGTAYVKLLFKSRIARFGASQILFNHLAICIPRLNSQYIQGIFRYGVKTVSAKSEPPIPAGTCFQKKKKSKSSRNSFSFLPLLNFTTATACFSCRHQTEKQSWHSIC